MMLIDGLERSGVDYCDVFISFLDSYSDGTHSLVSILDVLRMSTFSAKLTFLGEMFL